MEELILCKDGKRVLQEIPSYKNPLSNATKEKWRHDVGEVLDILSNDGDIKKIKLRHTLALEKYLTKQNIAFSIVGGELFDGDSIVEIKMKYVDQIKPLLVVGDDLGCADIVFNNGAKSSRAIGNTGKKEELLYLFNGPL